MGLSGPHCDSMFQSTPLLCMRVRPLYLPCSNLSLKCFASYSDGSSSHSWPQSSPCFASFSSRYFSASWTVRSAFGWDKPLFSFVMVFTVTDLGGVFHLRTVGRSTICTLAVLLPSTCSSCLVSLRPSTVYAARCLKCRLVHTLLVRTLLLFLALQFFRRVHVLSVRLFNLPSAHMCCTVASRPRPSA